MALKEQRENGTMMITHPGLRMVDALSIKRWRTESGEGR
jgi:hypothetical protein